MISKSNTVLFVVYESFCSFIFSPTWYCHTVLVNLFGVKWYLNTILTWISMITNEVEYLFMFTGHSGLLFAFSYLLLIFYWISIFPSALFFLICRKLKKKKKKKAWIQILCYSIANIFYTIAWFFFLTFVCVCVQKLLLHHTHLLCFWTTTYIQKRTQIISIRSKVNTPS